MDVNLKVVFEDKSKKKSSKYRFWRSLVSLGLGLISSVYYVLLMYAFDKSGFFKSSKSNTNAAFEVNFVMWLLIIGFFAIVYGLAFYFEDNKKSSLSKLFAASLLLLLLFFLSFSLLNGNKSILEWVQCIMAWVAFIFFMMEFIFTTLSVLIKKYTQLENKEQFTIGVGIFTFILGLLIGK